MDCISRAFVVITSKHNALKHRQTCTTKRSLQRHVTFITSKSLLSNITHSPSRRVLAVDTELTLASGDIGDAVRVAVDTLAPSVADDAGDAGVAGEPAVASVPSLTAVPGVAGVPTLDAVAAVPREMPVTGVRGDVRSGKPELRMLIDAGVAADVAVAGVMGVLGAEVTGAAYSVLGVSEIGVMGGAAVLDKASGLAVTAVAADASAVLADAVDPVANDDAGGTGVAGVAGVAAVAGEPVEAPVSAGPVPDAVAAVPTDIAPADVSGVAASLAVVTTLAGEAGVTVAFADDCVAPDGAVDVVSAKR